MSHADPSFQTGPFNAEALQGLLTFRISRVNARLNVQATQILKKIAGLSLVQWRLITSIHALGTTTSNQICRTTAMDKGLVSRKLKDLVADGFIDAQVNQNDNRQQMLSLTEKGERIHEAVQPIMRRRREYLMEQLTPDESQILFAALAKIDASADRVDF